MSDTLINLDPASRPILPTDLLYLVRGTGVDRDKQTNPQAVVEDLLAPVIDSAVVYPAANASATVEGRVPIVLANTLHYISPMNLQGQSYDIPASGTYAMKIRDSTGTDSVVTPTSQSGSVSLNYMRGVTGVFRWRVAWTGTVANASITSSARYVAFDLACPTPVVTSAEKVIWSVLSAEAGGDTHWPLLVCIAQARTPVVLKVSQAYTVGIVAGTIGNPTNVLRFGLLNSDGTKMTYAQLSTLLGALDASFFLCADANS